jgi:hypothetical protein
MKVRRKGAAIYASRKFVAFLYFAAACLLPLGGWLAAHKYPVAGVLFALAGIIAAKGAWANSIAVVALNPSHLEFGSLLRRESIPKEQIERVTWEKGVGVLLHLKDSTLKRIPDLGNSQSVTNAIRAWLNRK